MKYTHQNCSNKACGGNNPVAEAVTLICQGLERTDMKICFTSGPEQLRSLEIQIKTYTKMIRSHPNWIFTGVFHDIESGMCRSERTGLDKMLKKAAKGKIDYIITKSISRVSRDTLEILKIIRFLRERRINRHFENEKLDSINVDKKFEITLRGMLAPDESRNTSEDIQWGFQRKFEKGDIFTNILIFVGRVLQYKYYKDYLHYRSDNPIKLNVLVTLTSWDYSPSLLKVNNNLRICLLLP